MSAENNQQPSSAVGAPKKSSGHLLKSSALVGSMTLLSRVLGLLRDIVFAVTIGAAASADAFFVAFKIPNFLRRLFAEGAFSQAFVPVLAEYRQQGTSQAVKALIDRVAGCLGSVLLLLTVLVVMASPLVAALFAPGFWGQPEKFALTAGMIKVTFPYLFLISMTGLAGAILNSYDRFAVPAFTPVLLNLSLIGAALLAAPWFDEPAYALAWGVLTAGIVQLLFQLPFLQRIHLLPQPRVDWRDPGVRKILKLMAPAIFGVSVSQVNLLLDTVIASLLPNGSVSWLYYSDRLVELPLGVFGIAIATVILPSLSRQHVGADSEGYNRTLDWALRSICLMAVPAALALIVLAEPILTTLFFYGEILTERDMAMAALSLRAYAGGLLAFMLVKVLAPGYFARQDMRTPVKIGVIAMIANMVMNLVLVIPFHQQLGAGHVGLALATTLAAFLNAGLLYRGLRGPGGFRPAPGWARFLLLILLANALMLAVLFFMISVLQDWVDWQWWQRAIRLAVICGAGLFTYAAVLWLGGLRPGDLLSREARGAPPPER